MANDRVYIRCDTCGQHSYVGNYFPSVGVNHETGAATGDFITRHLNECFRKRPEAEYLTLGSAPLPFSVHCEGSLPDNPMEGVVEGKRAVFAALGTLAQGGEDEPA
jgi:hypothetical protein